MITALEQRINFDRINYSQFIDTIHGKSSEGLQLADNTFKNKVTCGKVYTPVWLLSETEDTSLTVMSIRELHGRKKDDVKM